MITIYLRKTGQVAQLGSKDHACFGRLAMADMLTPVGMANEMLTLRKTSVVFGITVGH